MVRRLSCLGLWLIGIAVFGALPAATLAHAQNTLRIAAVVNDEAISMLDVIDRTNLIFATTGLKDTPETRQRIIPQVLRTLIDEKLELQEAKKQGYSLDDIDLTSAYRAVEKNLGLQSGQLLSFIRYNNLSQESLDEEVKAELVWSDLIQRRMQNDKITDEDIDQELERIKATADEPTYLLAEIFLAVDEPSKEDEVKANMERLRDAIMGGASFPNLARQFSQGASSSAGGDLGWIAQSQLPEGLKDVVPSLPKGHLSDPIRVIGGYALVLMRDERVGFGSAQSAAQITMRQAIVVPLANETPDQLKARTAEIAGELKSCDAFDSVGSARPDVQTGSALNVALSDLQPQFLQAVKDLPVGQISQPVQTDQGMHLLMVCQRQDQNQSQDQSQDFNLPSRDEIRQKLENEQFDLISRGYLRDLRREAFVDVRL